MTSETKIIRPYRSKLGIKPTTKRARADLIVNRAFELLHTRSIQELRFCDLRDVHTRIFDYFLTKNDLIDEIVKLKDKRYPNNYWGRSDQDLQFERMMIELELHERRREEELKR